MSNRSEISRARAWRLTAAGEQTVDLAIYAIIAVIAVTMNMPSGTLFLFSDLFFPLTHDWQILRRYFTSDAAWNFPEFQNPRQMMQVGHQIFVFSLHAVGLPMELVQKTILVSLIVLCLVGVRELFARFFPDTDRTESKLLVVAAGLVYLFSPFVASVIWQRLNLGIYSFASFPLFAAMFADFVSRKGSYRSLLIGLLMLLVITQTSNPVFLAACLAGATLLTGVLALQGRGFSLVRFAVFGAGAVLVSSYWIVPFLINLEIEAKVAQNNVYASSITDMRRAISAYANFSNWFAMNPFWTGHDPNIVAGARLLEAVQPFVLALFASALAALGYVRAAAVRSELLVLLGLFLAYVLLLSDIYPITLPFWNALDAIKVGIGFRDPYEKTAFFGASLFSLIVFGAFANAELPKWLKLAVPTVAALVVAWPALSGNLFFKPDRGDGRIAQLGQIPKFFADPNSLRDMAGPGRRVLPMPFFELTLGSVYELERGNLMGMTPLYWQNDVQIVSGNNSFSRELNALLTSEDCLADCTAVASSAHAFITGNGIDTIFWSENFLPRPSERSAAAIQLRIMHTLLDAGCISQRVDVRPYIIFDVELECPL